MAMRTWRNILISWTLVLLVPSAGRALTPSPVGPVPSPSASQPSATRTLPRPTGTPTVRPAASATATAARAIGADEVLPEDPIPAATAVAPRAARAFRTPDRPAPPVFVPNGGAPDAAAPEGDAPAPMAPARRAPAARAGTALVVFRATARTAIEGFDVRVGYPRTVGQFATDGQQADCNAGTGTLVVASDRGTGELRLLVAGAQALPLPLDVFCRFAVTGGGGVDAAQFPVRVAEVTSGGKRADTSLLIVNVVVR